MSNGTIRIAPDSTGKLIDNGVYTVGGVADVYRQRVEVFGPNDSATLPVTGPATDAELRATPLPVSGTVATGGLTDTQLRASAVTVGFSGAFLSPFGDLIAQALTPLVQLDWVYGINTQTGVTTVVSTGTVDTNLSRLRIQTSTSTTGSGIFQSRKPAKYRAGQGVIIRTTAAFTTGVASSTQFVGIGTDTDGYFYGFNGAAFGILYRAWSSDTWIPQSSWNGDKCDGTGASGFNWDKTKGTVIMIKYPYLGYGNITFWVEDPATSGMILCHTIKYNNTTTTVQISNPNLFFYAQAINAGNNTNLIIYCGSAGVFLCGERSYVGNPKWAADSNKAAVTAETNLLSIRNATSYNGVTNRSLIRINSISYAGGSATATTVSTLRVRIGATVGGVPSFAAVNGTTANAGVTITAGNSIASIDTAGTTATGGTYLFNCSVSASGTNTIDTTPFNLFIAPGEIMTFSGFASANSSQVVSVNWTEDI